MELNKIKAKRNGLETTLLNLILSFETETGLNISHVYLSRTEKYDDALKKRDQEDVGILERVTIDLKC